MFLRLVLVVLVIAGCRKDNDDRQKQESAPKKPVALEVQKNWPVFRGDQGLTGRSVGILPDELDIAWKFKTAGPIKSSPVIADGVVYVGSSDANVYAIENGKELWQFKTGGDVESSPCVLEGSVYVGSSDGFLYALDANSGELRWKYETGDKILGGANWIESPDGKNKWILVGSYDGILYCVNTTDGNAVWTYETDNYINGAPAVGDGVAVVGGCDALIHVVSVADGNEIKNIDSGSYIAASAAINKGRVYVGNYDNVFLCADINAGQIVWQYDESDEPFYSSPALGDNVIIFGGRDGYLHCVNRANGKKKWTFKALAEIDSSPVICGDKVVVGSEDGRFYMIRLSDGEKLWSYETGKAFTSSPAVAGGLVVVGCDDGYVYAFGAR
jgi:outer membrane protein assembly factor BamB